MHPRCTRAVYLLFHSPPVICLTNVRNREYFPGWDPPSSVTCITTLGHTRHCVCLVLYCVTLFAVYLLFLPPSSPSVDPDTADVPETETDAETAGDTVEYDYLADDPSLSVELPGKHSPLFDHPDIAYILSTACIRVE
jgi:hypothetical protein